PEAIRAYALEHGPAYQHPRFIEFVDALPWQGTNKVDRKALRVRAQAFSRDAERTDTNRRQSG
ncbi:long-chain fatty acid--CoA ligase, partial [bacterium LRH843]|nr:long-chain fatty acid--CoA ligase [bacterium LRH843]